MFSLKKTYVLPFKYGIANYTKDYLKDKNLISRYLKYLKRYILIFLLGQKSLEVNCISSNQKNILWINTSAPSIGDSLMDLSSRSLLNDKRIDLYTVNKNAKIYKDDLYFSNVFVDKNLFNPNDYDLVILDSYSSRSLIIKYNIAPKTRFVGMFGFFNGPEVNRVLFSFHRMNQLLGYKKSINEILRIAKTTMFISTEDKKIISGLKLPENYIAIVIGGEWPYRTYNNWNNVIRRFFANDKTLNIVFVGSENGEDTSRKLIEEFSNFNVQNYVAKFTFNQTAEIIKRAKILLCCDGGLMHSANAVGTTVIPLLARLDENMQLTQVIDYFPLFDKLDVNNIDFESICKTYFEASKYFDNTSS